MSLAFLKVNAQSDTGAAASQKSLGIDIRPIFGGATGTSLQYQNNSWRLALFLSGGSTSLTDADLTNFNVGLRTGLGKQVGNDKVQFNYGSDVFVTSNGGKREEPGLTDKERETRFGLRPFAGISYQVTPRFSLSSEAYADLSYFTNTRTLTAVGAETEVTTSGLSYQFFNGLRFYARYHF